MPSQILVSKGLTIYGVLILQYRTVYNRMANLGHFCILAVFVSSTTSKWPTLLTVEFSRYRSRQSWLRTSLIAPILGFGCSR